MAFSLCVIFICKIFEEMTKEIMTYLEVILDSKLLMAHEKDKLNNFLEENGLSDKLENSIEEWITEHRGSPEYLLDLEKEIRELEDERDEFSDKVDELEEKISKLEEFKEFDRVEVSEIPMLKGTKEELNNL